MRLLSPAQVDLYDALGAIIQHLRDTVAAHGSQLHAATITITRVAHGFDVDLSVSGESTHVGAFKLTLSRIDEEQS